MEALLAVVLLALFVACLALAVVHARYRATHRISEAERAAEREAESDRVARKSRETSRGQAADYFAPWFPSFPYHPSDCRFVGHPIDHVVFDGLHERGVIDHIVLLEIKTGGSGLKPRQREVRRAVEEQRVKFDLFRLPSAQDASPVLERTQDVSRPAGEVRIEPLDPEDLPQEVRRRWDL